MIQPNLTADLCLKCNICTAACPVAAATDLFPGPKAVGPQAERYRHPRLPLPDSSVTWCSACGVCSRVCPHDVKVTEINIQAKARLVEERGAPLRDRLISNTELIGRLGTPLAPIANLSLKARPVRWIMEKTIGIHHEAPMPAYAGSTFRTRVRDHCVDKPPVQGDDARVTVAFFHGCSTNYYEHELGLITIAVLEKLGCRVILPPQTCCGLAMQSNSLFEDARRQARQNVALLLPFAEAGIPIVGTSTSCLLTMKYDYQATLGLSGREVELVAAQTFDVFEFMTTRLKESLDGLTFRPLASRAIYHAPCKLRSHDVGIPTLPVLRRIPQLEITLSEAECCGGAGTYGMKREKYEVARQVGSPLFEQAREWGADFIINESETCRWWIAKHTELPTLHPIEVLYRAMM